MKTEVLTESGVQVFQDGEVVDGGSIRIRIRIRISGVDGTAGGGGV